MKTKNKWNNDIIIVGIEIKNGVYNCSFFFLRENCRNRLFFHKLFLLWLKSVFLKFTIKIFTFHSI